MSRGRHRAPKPRRRVHATRPAPVGGAASGAGCPVQVESAGPRNRRVALGAMVVVAAVGVTGVVLTSSAAPAPQHAAATAPRPSLVPVSTASSAGIAAPDSVPAPRTIAHAVAPVPLAGPSAPTSLRPRPAPARAITISALTSDGIPSTALAAYRDAAAREATRDPGCGISWAVLAGIGRVESDHGRTGGAVLHTDGVASPRILGPRLDGHGTAVIRDTDNGRLDGDRVYDRAVGPMQFIPSTWAAWGVDANHDGVRDPDNIFDAAAAAADYLCADGRNLRTSSGLVRAIRSYNNSQAYITLVIATARSYAAGTAVVVPTAPTRAGKAARHPAGPGLAKRPHPATSPATSRATPLTSTSSTSSTPVAAAPSAPHTSTGPAGSAGQHSPTSGTGAGSPSDPTGSTTAPPAPPNTTAATTPAAATMTQSVVPNPTNAPGSP
jgi:membrane-bound lytic murein transglycosylase B